MGKPNLKPCAICGEDVEAKKARKSTAFKHLHFHEKCYIKSRGENMYKPLYDKNLEIAKIKEQNKIARLK